MKYILVALFLSSFQSGSSPDCETLAEGNYLMRITSDAGARDSRLRVLNYMVSSELGSEIVLSRILKNDSCVFSIELWNKSITPVSNNIEGRPALLLADNLGHSILELKKSSGDTTFFRITYSGQREKTRGQGYLLRLH